MERFRSNEGERFDNDTSENPFPDRRSRHRLKNLCENVRLKSADSLRLLDSLSSYCSKRVWIMRFQSRVETRDFFSHRLNLIISHMNPWKTCQLIIGRTMLAPFSSINIFVTVEFQQVEGQKFLIEVKFSWYYIL